MQNLSSLPADEKLFRLAVGLKFIMSETVDEHTREQIESMLQQLGLL